MFVLAGRSVWPAAVPEFDLVLVEVLLELRPFLRRDIEVFALWALASSVVQELLVVLDDVFGEDR